MFCSDVQKVSSVGPIPFERSIELLSVQLFDQS